MAGLYALFILMVFIPNPMKKVIMARTCSSALRLIRNPDLCKRWTPMENQRDSRHRARTAKL